MIKGLIKLVFFVALILFFSQFQVANQPIGALVHEKVLGLWDAASDQEGPQKIISAIGDIQLVKPREKTATAPKAKPESGKPAVESEEAISDEDRESLMQLLK